MPEPIEKYEPKNIEAKWQERWEAAGLFRVTNDTSKPKFYGLDFFPYPSGAGLSVGHCRNYIPTDVVCRLKVMEGFNVLHPMGWDAFGQPAENEAIKRQKQPKDTVAAYAANYKRQMKLIGISYDWDREINSSSPEYYKWTQWFFLLLYKRGLAYRTHAPANWCPSCKTLLANEEVKEGRCWRCSNPVEKKALPQWFFKITEYAERLINDLDTINWSDGIKLMQRNWIGKSQGVEFDMAIDGHAGKKLRVFTTRIDTVYGMTFAVMAPEHAMVGAITTPEQKQAVDEYISAAQRVSEIDRMSTERVRTGVFTGAYAINPANKQKVPIFIADYVLMGYGTGAIMAVPAHDTRDFDFATRYNVPINLVIKGNDGAVYDAPYTEYGVMMNSGEWDGTTTEEAYDKMGEWFERENWGVRRVNYRLRDWLISRQRYWGAPIPIIHCSKCGEVPVPEDQLPVKLPDVSNYQPTGTGESPLANIPEFVNVICPKCGIPARRETDTMGGFACSSWYFLRFADPNNTAEPFDKELAKYWLPVDCYVGGAEHAVMHLLYARFWTKVMHDAGLVPFVEPFSKLMNQGMLLANTPGRPAFEDEKIEEDGDDDIGAWVPLTPDERNNYPAEKIIYKYVKMSKSLMNVVTPDEMAEQYGADALRIYELFVAPFDQAIQWDDKGMQGAYRFLTRVWRILSEFQPSFINGWRTKITAAELSENAQALRRKTHQTLRKVRGDVDEFRFNTAVASLMEWLNSISDFTQKKSDAEGDNLAMSEAAESLILALAPMTPHLSDELWEQYGFEGFTYNQKAPIWDEAVAAENQITIAIQVNGKLRDTITVPVDTSNEELEKTALARPKILGHLEGKTVRKVIVIPGKLVNIVAN